MGLGTCRFCGAGRIAADAPICRECGGWYPNPGTFSRLGAMTGLLVGVVFLAFAGLIYVGQPDAYGLWGFFGFFGLLVVGRGIIRPYGKPYQG